MNRNKRIGLSLSNKEKIALLYLANLEGGLSQSALIRRLIRQSARN